ncbi:MAG: sucrose phosphorylase [Clostridiales bacterium]|nr:sucrose phosphorylase [Clostridiales bacterium]
MAQNEGRAGNGAMLNAYPDSMGGSLPPIVQLLQQPAMQGAFTSFYILPSLFNTDLDRGFSVIDYGMNELMGSEEDLDALRGLGMDLKLDFILNHCSVLSKQFQDLLQKGEESEYKDFFINWNRFWQGHGTMTPQGYLQPDAKLIENMFFRKPGLPILMVRLPDGKEVPYWNTFYQEVRYDPVDPQDLLQVLGIQYGVAEQLAQLVNTALQQGVAPADMQFGPFERYAPAVREVLEQRRKYLGQMDLNIRSPLVWQYYDDVLRTLAGYGARIVRLDAFAYAPKEVGARNFLNEPGTWDLLAGVQKLADKYQLSLLPEIHASYAEKTYETLAEKGYMTYDFFLPGLVLDALENGDGTRLAAWAQELVDKKIRVVNMLGCHDGIPLLDLKGMMPEEQIQKLIDTVVGRGGYVKNLHGQKNMYYQVNATYYSALGEDDRKLLLARALQLFMPGKPQVWYLDLFAGKNDHEAVRLAGPGGHKEINRTNLTAQQAQQALCQPVVRRQLELLRFRNRCAAFGFDAQLAVSCPKPHTLELQWRKAGAVATLNADLQSFAFTVTGTGAGGEPTFSFEQQA